MTRLAIFALCLSGLAVVSQAQAQDYTSEELIELFEAQRDAFTEVRTTGQSQTRGLSIVTVDDLQTDPDINTDTVALDGLTPETPSTDATELQPLQPLAPDTGTTEVATVVAGVEDNATPGVTPVAFGKLAPELQVNVRIEFDFDSAVVADAQKPKLLQLCEAMQAADVKLFRIAGHTDTSGTDAYNESLSLLRAEEVMRFLVGECGIAENRLEAIGMGERFPYNTDVPKAPENRRVEFQALS
ncbi:OmpA family protein [Aliiroseovarius sp. YM-037]|uniref:OmpA family protein n=1 Tax=Aliiroseovarius sp. YM-037 TaxID=3341728 RepID=UPI003A7FCC73